MTYEMCMLEKDLGCQKTFRTSESLFVMGPILFSSEECIELTVHRQYHCNLMPLKRFLNELYQLGGSQKNKAFLGVSS